MERNPCLLHWQVDSLPLSHQGSPISQPSSGQRAVSLTVKGDRPGWRGKWPHSGPRVAVMGRSPCRGKGACALEHVGGRRGCRPQSESRAQVGSSGRDGQPGAPSWARGSDFTPSCGPTAPSLALDSVLLAPQVAPSAASRGPAASWLAPGVSTPAAHAVGPLVASVPLRCLPLKKEAGAASP